MAKKRDDCREVTGDEASSGVEARLGMFHGVRKAPPPPDRKRGHLYVKATGRGLGGLEGWMGQGLRKSPEQGDQC